jgi:putative inorganic carbon (HCO3(-)) transporter
VRRTTAQSGQHHRREQVDDLESEWTRDFPNRQSIQSDYEAVRPSSQARANSAEGSSSRQAGPIARVPYALGTGTDRNVCPTNGGSGQTSAGPSTVQSEPVSKQPPTKSKWNLKRGHALSYAGIFLFTIVLYARPAEFYPSRVTASLALIIALATLAFFVPTQLSLEGTLTARPAEVNLVLLFCATGLLSIPLAINPPIAWQEFSGTFIRCIVMFVVIVNVVRTRTRLKGLLFLALGASLMLSIQAVSDYQQGLMTIEGYRASGRGTGIFGNTNDMALHVVTIFPITIALLFGSKGLVGKLLYGACAALMLGAIVLSYSRGAFVSLIIVVVFLAMKIGPRHRVGIVLAVVVLGGAVLLFAPDKYGGRLLSIFVPSLDPGGSSDARRGELMRSLYLAIRHPLLGIGMGNYQPEMSYRGLVTHNSYTQVAAEMGATALISYTLFMVTPLRKLGQIARETFEKRGNSQYYYLAVGLQASLLGYMVASFFLSVAYVWYVYYLVAFAVCLRRLYEAETGAEVVVEPRKERKRKKVRAPFIDEGRTVAT